jgi:hypothetical protein
VRGLGFAQTIAVRNGYSNFDPERAKPVIIDARKCVRGLGFAQTAAVRNGYTAIVLCQFRAFVSTTKILQSVPPTAIIPCGFDES